MSKVMMWCGNKGTTIHTGIVLPYGEPLTGLEEERFVCSACGFEHAVRSPFYEEDGVKDENKRWHALDLLPEVATEVGIMVSVFWSIEHTLPRIFHNLTGATWDDSEVIVNYFKSFSDKGELIKLIALRRPADDIFARQILDLLPILKEANSTRNKYVHAKFSIGANRILHLAPFAADSRRRPKTEIKKYSDIVADTNIIRNAAAEAHSCAFPPVRR